MTKFKVGDTVKRIDGDGGIPELRVGAITTVTGAEAGYVKLAHDPRWLCDYRFAMVSPAQVDEELPPAPDSVSYQHCTNHTGRLIGRAGPSLNARWSASFFGGPAVRIFIDNNDNGITLEPDDAIQLAHDIYRMARAAKKAQAK